jgi:hypothetical protein
MAMVHTLFAERLVDLGAAAEFVASVDVVEGLARDFSPEAVASLCGIDAATIRRLARELATAPTAAVYGRTGTCTQEFGTVASWRSARWSSARSRTRTLPSTDTTPTPCSRSWRLAPARSGSSTSCFARAPTG